MLYGSIVLSDVNGDYIMKTQNTINAIVAISKLENREQVEMVISALRRQQSILTQKQTMQFAIGDRVKFEHNGKFVDGFVFKINRKTIGVSTPTSKWNVSPSFLTAVA